MATKKAKPKSKQPATKDKASFVQDSADQLLVLMGTDAKATVSEDKENEAINVDIETEKETGLLIGRHGETLDAIQLVLSMMVFKKFEDWTRVIVNVGDWREKQADQLESLALQAAERARETGEPQNLFNLNASQRRIIHMYLSKEKDLETESSGEGKERFLVIKPRK